MRWQGVGRAVLAALAVGGLGLFRDYSASTVGEAALAAALSTLVIEGVLVGTLFYAFRMHQWAERGVHLHAPSTVDALAEVEVLAFEDAMLARKPGPLQLEQVATADALLYLDDEAAYEGAHRLPEALVEEVMSLRALVETGLLVAPNGEVDARLAAFGRRGGLGPDSLLIENPRVRYEGGTMGLTASVHEAGEEYRVAVCGSPVAALDLTTFHLAGDRIEPLTPDARALVREQAAHMEAAGLEVEALATGALAHAEQDPFEDLIFVGLLGRRATSQVYDDGSVEAVWDADVRPLLLTAQAEAPAQALAVQAGLREGRVSSGVVDSETVVAAGLTPRRWVDALYDLGEPAVVTGHPDRDGVALWTAHVGAATHPTDALPLWTEPPHLPRLARTIAACRVVRAQVRAVSAFTKTVHAGLALGVIGLAACGAFTAPSAVLGVAGVWAVLAVLLGLAQPLSSVDTAERTEGPKQLSVSVALGGVAMLAYGLSIHLLGLSATNGLSVALGTLGLSGVVYGLVRWTRAFASPVSMVGLGLCTATLLMLVVWGVGLYGGLLCLGLAVVLGVVFYLLSTRHLLP